MKQAIAPTPVSDDADDLDDESLDGEAEDPEEGRTLSNPELVRNFIRMWPRAIFNAPAVDGQKVSIARGIPELERPGVYILYRDDVPFYVGQTSGKLRSRLRTHATGVNSLKTYFWNYFSAFIVENASHRDEVEAILISAMPSLISNSSTPTLNRVQMRGSVRRLMRQLRKKG